MTKSDKAIILQLVEALLELIGERHGKRANVLKTKVEAIRDELKAGL